MSRAHKGFLTVRRIQPVGVVIAELQATIMNPNTMKAMPTLWLT